MARSPRGKRTRRAGTPVRRDASRPSGRPASADGAPTSAGEPPAKAARRGRSLAAAERAREASAAADPTVPAADGRQDPSPWWKDGLRFECTACGRCCTNHDEYAYVFSSRAERKAIAEHLGLSLRAFEAKYTERVEGGARSFVSEGDACVFLEEHGRCAIYALRPKQCRTFPFWPELLADEDSWERDVASFCPGAGRGTLHDADTIRERLSEWEP